MSKPLINLEKLLSFLVDGKIVPKDVLPTLDLAFDDKTLIECMNLGSNFEYDSINDELFIITNSGDRIQAPDLSEGTSISSSWIVDYLPDVCIDIDQGGNVRKGDEAESCYKILCIGYVLKDFKNEIIDCFKAYDYDRMVMKDGSRFNSFNYVLQYFQNFNSVRINSIVSAASLKMSMYKEKNESYYTGLLDSEEIIKLSTLSRELKAKISEYEKDKGLNPYDIKNMSKISKLTIIDERDRALDKIISTSEVGMLYRISKLTSERIPPVLKSKILFEAERAGKEYVREKGLSGLDGLDVEQQIRRTVIRESNRAILKSIKAKEIQKYKDNKNDFKFKTKS